MRRRGGGRGKRAVGPRAGRRHGFDGLGVADRRNQPSLCDATDRNTHNGQKKWTEATQQQRRATEGARPPGLWHCGRFDQGGLPDLRGMNGRVQ